MVVPVLGQYGVEYHQLGIVGRRGNDTAREIRKRIETVLVDETIRGNVTRMRR